MLQKTYSIYSETQSDGQLFIEAGKNHFACWRKDREKNQLSAFEFFQCDAYTGASFDNMIDSARLHSKLLAEPRETTHFILNTDEALCLPVYHGHTDDDFMRQNFNLLFGPSADTNILSAEYHGYIFASRIKRDLQNSVQSFLAGVQLHSQFACLLPALITNGNADIVYLFFYPSYFSLIAFNNGELQLLQTKAYTAPEDVLYFVLNVFKQYNINKETEILTGGFIDEESKLYQVLYQYLEGLRPAQVDESLFASGEFKNYSSHYFLPYANYVL